MKYVSLTLNRSRENQGKLQKYYQPKKRSPTGTKT